MTCKTERGPRHAEPKKDDDRRGLWDKTKPSVERPLPRLDWEPPNPGDLLKIISAIYNAADLLNMLTTHQNVTPDQDTSTHTAPGAQPGSGSGPVDQDTECSKDRSQRFHYQPMVGGRPTGVTALICPSDLKPANAGRDDGGSVDVKDFPLPGFNEELKPGKWMWNRTHILGDRFHGEWREENLFTGHNLMNTGGMKACENRMAEQLAANRAVQYSGQLEYSGKEGIPVAIRMKANLADGSELFDKRIENTDTRQRTCHK
ncbi:DNA/RNA non-specific endonuclease [Kitasatospora sp. NPDC098652]|uniref:DNA/RNA non-specific endonuclease n=1 Tax=Kitasatospora sp. NPDC098652 TaxID=3364095 RepID=UPI00380CF19A